MDIKILILLGESCGPKVCRGNEKCCKIRTCEDKCFLGLKYPDPKTWKCEEVCQLQILDCQDYIAENCTKVLMEHYGNIMGKKIRVQKCCFNHDVEYKAT